jgi:hypothetical protein
MQTRKLSVKTVYDLTLAEGLRVSVVVHTLTEITEPKSASTFLLLAGQSLPTPFRSFARQN